jgi:C-terminal processing protease CtpA/Prc
MYDREGRLVRTNATLEKLPGARFDEAVPVYVLTSARTGSAAEGFAFALQQSGRGTVVGETTRGMAHPCEEEMVNPLFLVSVPIHRVQSAFTKKSFQGVGVVPDISVPEQDALDAAIKDAEKRAHDRVRGRRPD